MFYKACFLLLIICSCSTTYYAGTQYGSKDGYYFLNFKNDSFIYSYHCGYHYNISKGYYKIAKKQIILSSNYDTLFEIPMFITEIKNNRTDSLIIEISNKMPIDSMCKYIILINGKEYASSVYKHFIIKQLKEGSNIQLKLSCNYNGIPFAIRDTLKSNVLYIKNVISNLKIVWDIEGELFYYTPIKDTIIIKKKKIYWPSKNIKLSAIKTSSSGNVGP
jgi:hypothetical protein